MARVHPLTIDLTGQRFGSLVVLSMHPGKGSTGARAFCECDCGFKRMVPSRDLTGTSGRAVRACLPCTMEALRKKTAARAIEISTRLPDGRTVAQVAAAAGLKTDTVAQRHRRGWPAWRLGEVTQKRRSA